MGLIRRKYINGILSILLYGVIVVSLIWTFLSIAVLIRTRLLNKGNPIEVISAAVDNNSTLPRFDDDSLIKDLAAQFSLLSDSNYGAAIDSSSIIGDLISASINFRMVDSTYFYRLVYLEECDCPARKLDRYDIYLEYINPYSLHVFKKDHYRRFSAEDVYRLYELVNLERR